MPDDNSERLAGGLALSGYSSQIIGGKKTDLGANISRRYRNAASALDGELIHTAEGTFIKISTDFCDDYYHGGRTLGSFHPAVLRADYFLDGDSESIISEKRLLFFDIETTGLSGGSGTVAFLIGFGSITPGGFQVRQYFLPDYPDEQAMLEAVRKEIAQDSIIVSYNGRAFDLPILLDRFVLHRVERNLELGGHIDLLHSARRLYKRRLKDCSLGNIEREIFGCFRRDDISGYLIPAVYFDWLSAEETSELKQVVKHNLYDIVSLYFLMHKIAEARHNPKEAALCPDDVYSLARILERQGLFEELCDLLTGYENIFRSQRRHDILFYHSLFCRRTGRLSQAVSLWEEIAAGDSKNSFYARIELAKYYEHRLKAAAPALEQAYAAKSECPPKAALIEELNRRIRRLEKKSRR
jgi:uncharacterized protein YprB with RNaseH-like and TPR domain